MEVSSEGTYQPSPAIICESGDGKGGCLRHSCHCEPANPHPSANPLPYPGTEIAGSFLTGSPLQPQAPATFSTPAVGHCPVILAAQPDGSQRLSVHSDEAEGASTGSEEKGNIQAMRM